MFHFLVVEDEEDTASVLEALLRKAFPESKVDTVFDSADGERHIEENRAWPYDAIVLDMVLPRRGGVASLDKHVFEAALREMPNVVIANITAHVGNEGVGARIEELQHHQVAPRSFLVTKLTKDWTDQLLKTLKSHLYGNQIERELDEMFGEAPSINGIRKTRLSSGAPLSGGSTTHRLAALSRDITAHFDEVDLRLQRRIEAHFDVDPLTRTVSLR